MRLEGVNFSRPKFWVQTGEQNEEAEPKGREGQCRSFPIKMFDFLASTCGGICAPCWGQPARKFSASLPRAPRETPRALSSLGPEEVALEVLSPEDGGLVRERPERSSHRSHWMEQASNASDEAPPSLAETEFFSLPDEHEIATQRFRDDQELEQERFSSLGNYWLNPLWGRAFCDADDLESLQQQMKAGAFDQKLSEYLAPSQERSLHWAHFFLFQRLLGLIQDTQRAEALGKATENREKKRLFGELLQRFMDGMQDESFALAFLESLPALYCKQGMQARALSGSTTEERMLLMCLSRAWSKGEKAHLKALFIKKGETLFSGHYCPELYELKVHIFFNEVEI